MALIVRNLSKYYGSQIALHSVDLSLLSGTVALLGPNGSGKSTLLHILATLCKPDTGELSFDGWIYGQHTRPLRVNIGYLPQDFEMPDTLTVRKLLTYLAQLRGADVSRVLDVLHLEGLVDEPFRQLSNGQIRLVGIAQALLGNPRLLLLDELSRGLDVVERERIYRVIADFGKLTIFSTHVPEEAERLAQGVIVMHKGRVLFCGTVEALRASALGQVFEICVPNETLPQLMSDMAISRIIPRGTHTLVRVVGKLCSLEAVLVTPSLEDAYLLLTHRLVNK